MGVIKSIDPKEISQAGWGIIFAHDADPLIKEALGELIALRQEQAGERFRLYEKATAHQPGESKSKFLARHGAGPGPADPNKVPYYLLIVGSPERIPYRFQQQLSVQYATGRIHFADVYDYARYAQSVVAAESGRVKVARKVALFTPTHPGDGASQLTYRELAGPLFERLLAGQEDWQIDAYQGGSATKAWLGRVLGGEETPALLMATAHGLSFANGAARQFPHQGALLCQDWPGPQEWSGAIPQDFYFAGDDLGPETNLLGLIACFYASYSAGAPQLDEFARQARRERSAIAPHAFLAQLPAKMLARPRGGALAVVGLTEQAWAFSPGWPGSAKALMSAFESFFRRLQQGYPVGSAAESFDHQYAELSMILSDELEEIEFGKKADPYKLTSMWTANNDTRSLAIIGDPAARLPLAGDGVVSSTRPDLEDVKPLASERIEAELKEELLTRLEKGGLEFF